MSKKATIEEMRAEAVARMKMMGVWDVAVKEFETKARVMSSERPFGAFYDLSEEQ